MRNFILLGCACSAVLLAGCGGGSNNGNDTTRSVTTTGQNGALRYSLTMKDSYALGETVKARYTVENTGTEAITYDSCAPIEVNVRPVSKNVNYPIRYGCPGPITTQTYEPGRTYNFPVTWYQAGYDADNINETVVPGQYVLDAKDLSKDGAGPVPITFTIHSSD